LTIRGTFSMADAISDIVCDEDPFLDGFAHRGILNGARFHPFIDLTGL
jgi:hypothetical protein